MRLINSDHYPVLGLIFNGAGCLFWVLAYGILVWEIRKKKFVEMPVYVAGANIGWELVWSFIYHPDTGSLFAFSYQAAFFLDCFIFYSILRYGSKQPMNADSKTHLLLFCSVNFAFWIFFCYFFMKEGYDTNIGANSGYIINVILSLQCVFMLLQTKKTENFSLLLAWSRTLGTGLITVSMFIFYPESRLIQLLGCTCFLLDISFIAILTKRHKKLFIS
jgi:hypothetical protein